MGDTEKIGWQVLDPNGQVIDSGEVTIARAAGTVAEALDKAAEE